MSGHGAASAPVLDCASVAELAGVYVLGALEVSEAAAVRRHLETCPEPHADFAQVGAVAAALFEAVDPVAPPPRLRARVMERIALEARASNATQPAAPITLSRPPGGALRRPAAVGERPGFLARLEVLGSRLMPLAALLLIGVLAGWNLLLQQDAQRSGERVATLRDAVTLSQSPDAAIARFEPTDPATTTRGFAAVAPDGTGVLVISGLDPAPAGRTYQAWYLLGTTPRSAGLVHVEADGLGVLSGLQRPPGTTQMALTLEPAPGSDAPTSDPLAEASFTDG